MSEKEKKPTFKWLEKLKNVKHIEIYIAIIFIVIILLIYLSNTKTKETSTSTTNDMTVTAYIESIEQNHYPRTLSSKRYLVRLFY